MAGNEGSKNKTAREKGERYRLPSETAGEKIELPPNIEHNYGIKGHTEEEITTRTHEAAMAQSSWCLSRCRVRDPYKQRSRKTPPARGSTWQTCSSFLRHPEVMSSVDQLH